MRTRRPARLCLADGTTFEGEALGAIDADPIATGEVVFTTGMTGYQEVLSDPSYTGQIVTMTAPHIGNTGANATDPESAGDVAAVGLICRELSPISSSWRSEEDLASWLLRSDKIALTGIDTRRLTRHLRDRGSQNGAIGFADRGTLVDHARAAPSMEGLDLVGRVTCPAPFEFTNSTAEEFRTLYAKHAGPERPHVVAIDFGLKRSILSSLVDCGCRVTVVPATTNADAVLALKPDGVFVSNGPGDPAAVGYGVTTLRGLLGKTPIFGICLGHQLLSLACGAQTYKLKFGHRGLNQPVQNLRTGRVEITSQNHGFAVRIDSLPKDVTTSYVHLNDGTSEGLEIRDAKAFSVQFHPEAAAGPHDTLHLFEEFSRMMRPEARAS